MLDWFFFWLCLVHLCLVSAIFSFAFSWFSFFCYEQSLFFTYSCCWRLFLATNVVVVVSVVVVVVDVDVVVVVVAAVVVLVAVVIATTTITSSLPSSCPYPCPPWRPLPSSSSPSPPSPSSSSLPRHLLLMVPDPETTNMTFKP